MSDFSKKDVKKGKERKAFFTDATVKAFKKKDAVPSKKKGEVPTKKRDGTPKNEETTFVYNSVDYMMPLSKDHDVSTGCFPVGGITLAEQELQRFLYMDVGRWGGSGGDDDADDHWPGDRYFGLTCGEVAALCRYAPPTTRERTAGPWQASKLVSDPVQSHDDFCRMVPLLNHLSSDPSLGRVEVLKALACSCPKLKAPSSETIYVYLGDLHAPIITKAARTDFPEITPFSPTQPELTWVDRLKMWSPLLRPLLSDDHPAAPPEAVSRMGRLILADSQVEAVVKVLSKLANKNYRQLLADPSGMSLALFDLCLLIATLDVASIEQWHDQRRFLKHGEADRWFDLYHGTAAKKGADIFEEAGEDLRAWIALLHSYQNGHQIRVSHLESSHKQEPARPIRLIQVGDMFDLWLGLGIPMHVTMNGTTKPPQAKFTGQGEVSMVVPVGTAIAAAKKLQPIAMFAVEKLIAYMTGRGTDNLEVKLGYTGVESSFASYWLKETLTQTNSSETAGLKALLNAQFSPLNAIFIAGNHDNYLAFGKGRLPEPFSGVRIQQAFTGEPGLFVDHGLPSDAYNKDASFPIGWLLTQAAFVKPAVRLMETALGTTVADWFGGYCERLQRIEGAAQTCLANNARSYVMGHTHRPFLTEVVIKGTYLEHCVEQPTPPEMQNAWPLDGFG